jgi:hypothetical protein
MHQPFRASKIANAPPKILPATASHPIVAGKADKYVKRERMIPKTIATIPV